MFCDQLSMRIVIFDNFIHKFNILTLRKNHINIRSSHQKLVLNIPINQITFTECVNKTNVSHISQWVIKYVF